MIIILIIERYICYKCRIHSIQGLAEWTENVGEKLGLRSISDLGNWKYFKWASAMVTLAEREVEGKRVGGSKMNVNKGLIKEHEEKCFKNILKLRPSALQGLGKHCDKELAAFHIYTIEDLGTWRYAKWASAITVCAGLETKNVDDHK
mmetsp:Transcript_904/g.1124  ORF Transcript_904/g.1124 Transcript_904/m.1124 type:complete len:148 (+) Transcript_904:699-1142(+)